MNKFKSSFLVAAAAFNAAASLVLTGCDVQTTTTTTGSSGTVITKNGNVIFSSMHGGSSGEAKFTATDSRSASAGASPRVTITNDVGSIAVSAGAPGSMVLVRAIKHAVAQADLAKLVLVVTQTESGVDVRLKEPSPAIDNLYADLEIVVPAGASVDETAVSGSIKTAGISVVVAENSNGDITLQHIGGSVKAQTVSGSVTVSGGGAGPLNLSSSNGSIVVEAGNYRQAISASTVNGSINIQGSLPSLTLQTTNGYIDVVSSSPLSGTNTMSAVSGGISVAVPRSSKLTVDAQTTTGSIDNDFGLTVTPDAQPTRLRGVINSGGAGATLSMSSSNGSIDLKAN